MVLSGCLDGAGPAAEVSGVWTASAGPFGMTLELVQRGEAVTGTGASYAFSSPTSVTFAIAGTYSAPHLALTFTRDTLLLAEFDGTVVVWDAIDRIDLRQRAKLRDRLVTDIAGDCFRVCRTTQ